MDKSEKHIGSSTLEEDTKPINYYRLEGDIKHLLGRILTIVDASIADKQQNKALKDLIKQEVRNLLFQYQDFFWEGKKGQGIPL